MGRNQRPVWRGDDEEGQQQEERYNNRQSRNLRQDKRQVILGHVTGPVKQRAVFYLAMMTGGTIAPTMEMKVAGFRLLEIVEAGRANEPGQETNADQEAREQHQQQRGLARPSRSVHGAEYVVHQQNLLGKKTGNLRNGRRAVYRHLLTDATHLTVGRDRRER